MPRVEIDTPGVTIRLDANEVSIETLGAQALALYIATSNIDHKTSPGPAVGFGNERRASEKTGYGTQRHQPQPRQEAD